MNLTINWPTGEFTLQDAIAQNPKVPQTQIREELAAGITRKAIVQTRKGNQKVKGAFQVVPAVDSPAPTQPAA